MREAEPTAYTYAIHWTAQNKSYYGVRFADGCNTLDLWKTYFTSSKYVKEFRHKFGEPDIILIDQMFYDKQEAIDYEAWILKGNDVRNNDDWLNITDTNCLQTPKGEAHYMYGKKHSAETRAKMSETKQKSENPAKRPEVRMLISDSLLGDNHPRYDNTIYEFRHKNGLHFIGTTNEISKEYSLDKSDIRKMATGQTKSDGYKVKSVKGWCIFNKEKV